MRLTVMDVRNGEAQAGVLHERLDGRVRVDDVGGLLFPLAGVCNDIVYVALDHVSNFLARPVVDVRGGTRSAAGFITRNFRSFALRRVRTNGLDQTLDGPTVVRRQEQIQTDPDVPPA